MVTLAVVIAVSLGISFLCSILEAVLLSISHSYVAVLQERGSRAGALLARMRENIDEPIAAILTLNTIAHTVGAAMGGALALTVFGEAWIAAFSAVLTLAILVFSEILPKTIGASYWQTLAPPTAFVLRILIVVLKPVLVPLAWFNRLISPRGRHAPRVSRAELEVLAELGRKEGVLDEDEWQVVTNVMNLDQIHVSEVMTPRTQIVAVEVEAGVGCAKDLFLESGHGRLPVYRGALDEIAGIVLSRDLWRATEEGITDLREVMRDPYFVPETKPVEDLIREMRKAQIGIAIVIDEFGGTAGLVTLEDLIEEIVGEIRDEHDLAPLPFEAVEGEVRMAGNVPVWDVNERFGLDLPEGDYTTIGGFILGALGRIPEEGAEVPVGKAALLRVLRMDGRRISRVAFVENDPGASAR
ncbi:MAG TPA: hemolysin family protein [Longimicrobiales bacterium]|nr:hemolysin family protein [Longimicrobiales bacterium]